MREQSPLEISPEARKLAIASIQRYFTEELDQQIGDLKAALLLDYFVAEVGPAIYNRGIADAQEFLQERASDLAAVYDRTEFPYWEGLQRRDAARPAVRRTPNER